jgi:cytosine/uracil/thiamine/allantoin permease
MESLDELSKINNGKPGFVKHVFNFDEDSKADMLNIVQYAVLALIPVVIFNKLMQKYIPEADEEKSSMEISAEILAQVISMFLVILLVHRLITFVPTYSGEKYKDFSVTNIVLAMLTIVLSLQTKLGEKVSILVDRVIELWEGPKDTKKGKNGKGNVKVSQPISQNQAAINQSIGTTSIAALPMSQPTQTQQLPDYNQMYQQDNTPLIGAASPGIESMEPMAANAMGGGAFGSLW